MVGEEDLAMVYLQMSNQGISEACRAEGVNGNSEQLKTWFQQTGTLINYALHIR